MIYTLLLEDYDFKIELLSIICYILLGVVIIYFFLRALEMVYGLRNKRPYYVHFYFRLLKLSDAEKLILKNEFLFYSKLDSKHKLYFEHRVARFIKDKNFTGREGLICTNEMKVLIAATSVMLTFGFRKYLLRNLHDILIYPGVYYSNINKEYHKGEFNPRLKMLVISWEDFLKGYEISNDNLNLGMHEIAHAIHINSLKAKDISNVLFRKTFLELTSYLQNNEDVRKQVIDTKYFRAYAFTNQYEFLSVLIETFFETPSDFRYNFPEIYKYLKQMLNFNYADY